MNESKAVINFDSHGKKLKKLVKYIIFSKSIFVTKVFILA